MENFLFLGQPSEYFLFASEIIGMLASVFIAGLVAHMQYKSHKLEVERKNDEKREKYFILHDTVVSFSKKCNTRFFRLINSLLSMTEDRDGYIRESKEEFLFELRQLDDMVDSIDYYRLLINKKSYSKDINSMVKDLNALCHKISERVLFVDDSKSMLDDPRMGLIMFVMVAHPAIKEISDYKESLLHILMELEEVVWGHYESLVSED